MVAVVFVGDDAADTDDKADFEGDIELRVDGAAAAEEIFKNDDDDDNGIDKVFGPIYMMLYINHNIY